MSVSVVRPALESRLMAMPGALPGAYQNVAFEPVVGEPYWRVFVLPAMPDNPTTDERMTVENGIFQVTLVYPKNTGTGASEAMAKAIEDWFPAGFVLSAATQNIRIRGKPYIMTGAPEADVYTVPVRIEYRSIFKG